MNEKLAWLAVSALLFNSLSPAAAAAAVADIEPVSAPEAAPLPVPSLPVSAVPGVVGASADLLPVAGLLPADQPAAAVPGAQAQAQAMPAAASAASPSASAAAPDAAAPGDPSAAADAGKPSATAALSRLDPSAQPPNGSSPRDVQAAVYDAARPGSSAQASAVAADYTATAPELPLSLLTPQWRAALPAGERKLPAVGKAASVRPLGTEEQLSAGDKLETASADSALSRAARPDGLSYFDVSAFSAKDGVKQAAFAAGSLVWLDESGKLYRHDLSRRKTTQLESPMGAVERFAVGGDGALYVAAGGHIQRWNLETDRAAVYLDERIPASGGVQLTPTPEGVEAVTSAGRFLFSTDGVSRVAGGQSYDSGSLALQPLSGGLYWSQTEGETRLWTPVAGALKDAGAIPVTAEAAAVGPGGTLYAVAQGSLYEWNVAQGSYRRIEVPGLADAVAGRAPAIVAGADGSVVVTAADKLFVVNPLKPSSELSSKEAQARLWSEQNPMSVSDGLLHIGGFTFPIAAPRVVDNRSGWRKLIDRILGRPAPGAQRGPLVSETDWQALNLPSNKLALYQTLKGFSLGQHVLYIGETGGGKTWMASMVAKITGNDLWMVSLTEYTRNQDLIARDTFGEEGKNKTGLSMSVVLKWLQNGGVLLLDEMHKPLEGIASLNNILQNLEYRMPDGRVIKGDPKKCFVIGTMNPVKPPYRGEPPSGELESRFGVKLQINYLPPEEEAALLRVYHPAVSDKMATTLIKIANDLRKVYPDVLPLPISSRTLLHIVQHMEKYPGDDPVEIFKISFNPTAIVDDPSIGAAIDKALQAHDLRGAKASAAPDQKKKLLTN